MAWEIWSPVKEGMQALYQATQPNIYVLNSQYEQYIDPCMRLIQRCSENLHL